MANDLNQCQFIGRLGKDPEVRYMASGDAVCSFSLAVGEHWKDKATGNRQEKTTWVPIVIFGKLAEVAGEYLKKGSKIFAQGKFSVRKWQDQNGNDRYTTEVVLSTMQMLDNKNQDQGGGSRGGNSAYGDAAGTQHREYQNPAPSAGADFEDDIPFLPHEKGTIA